MRAPLAEVAIGARCEALAVDVAVGAVGGGEDCGCCGGAGWVYDRGNRPTLPDKFRPCVEGGEARRKGRNKEVSLLRIPKREDMAGEVGVTKRPSNREQVVKELETKKGSKRSATAGLATCYVRNHE